MPKDKSLVSPLKQRIRRRILYLSHPDRADRICSGCETCQLMCSLEHTGAFNPLRSRIKVVPLSVGVTIPVTCQQCEDPWCQKACPEKAIVPHKGLSIPVVDEKKCTGCMNCIGACPFGIMVFDPGKKKALKCDLCGGTPACVQHCPSKVLVLAGHGESAEIRRRRFAALLASEDDLARPVLTGADPVKTLPRTLTQAAAQSRQLAEGRK